MFSFFISKISTLVASVVGFWDAKSSVQLELELKKIFLDADVPLKMVEQFCKQVVSRLEGQIKKLPKADKQELLQTSIYQELLSFLGPDQNPVHTWPQAGIILFMGLQGAGKTTSIAKIGKWLQEHRPHAAGKVFCTSVDFQRPAAIEQLQIMAEKAKINFVSPVDFDIAQTVNAALELYRGHSNAFLLLDTAGRLNVDLALMEELKQIIALSQPNFKVLVIDSMTGQKSLEVVHDFDTAIGVDSAILTKMDSDSRAGSALSLRWATKKSISFVATGEKVDDLEPFLASRCASRIVGSGDIATLSDKIEGQIKKVGQESSFNAMTERMMSGKITLQDFLQQIELIGSLGSMGKLMSYLPGSGALSQSQMQQSEAMAAIFKSLIQSMTPAERLKPEMLDRSRKQRICHGAGRKSEDLERLLEKFEESKRFATILSRFKR